MMGGLEIAFYMTMAIAVGSVVAGFWSFWRR